VQLFINATIGQRYFDAVITIFLSGALQVTVIAASFVQIFSILITFVLAIVLVG